VRKAEGIAFGLRTALGVSASEMTSWRSEVDALRQEGYIQEENARIRLTAKGRMVADSIAELFV
jgi:coproporphyrinogen III oxidase-like Fe-S oxidoreductase